jgi:uncharacterized protein (TIGR02421 family)
MRPEALAALDRDVTRAVDRVRVLHALQWPEDAEHRFLADAARGSPAPPGVRLPPPDLGDIDAELAALGPRLAGDHPGLGFLRRTVTCARVGAAMLVGLGTPAFPNRSLELYGRPDAPVHGGAPTTLAAARHFLERTDTLRVPPPPAELDAAAAADWLRTRLDRLFPDDPPRVELDPAMPSLAAAGSVRIRLRADGRFRAVQLRQLLEHEVLVHTATRRAGKAQPVLSALGLAAPRTTATQEGLATLAEVLSDTLDLARLRRIALRVVALQAALEGADFIDVYSIFCEGGQGVEESFHSARRVFRGGDGHGASGVFAKDVVYVRGLLQVHGFLLAGARDGHPDLARRLFAGRLTLGDVIALEPLFEDGTIVPATRVPRWALDPDCLAAQLVFSGLVTEVDLGEVALADFEA